MKDKYKRSLTTDERKILEYIQDLYGEQNSEEDVFFTEKDQAVIFVKDINGIKGICVVLTNVAEFAKLDNLTREEICKQYLLIPDSSQ